TEVFLLLRRKTIEPHQEEVAVQLIDHRWLHRLYVSKCYWRTRRVLPDVIPPLLEEVRVAMSNRDDAFERSTMELHVRAFGWNGNRGHRVRMVERSDIREVEKSLRIGFRVSSESRKLWQTGSDENHGQV